MLKLDESYKPRPWCCEHCGWVLGFMVRDANRMCRLNVFRQTKSETEAGQFLAFPDAGLYMFGHACCAVIGLDNGLVWCA